MTNLKRIFTVSGLTLLGLFIGTAFAAESKQEINKHVTSTLNTFYTNGDEHKALVDQAAGVLVFPRITKGGVGIAGEHGEGALRVKGDTVGYYNISGGSVGLTLGAARHSEVLLFMTQQSLDKFIASKGWTIGVDSGLAIVSEGAGGNLDTKTLQKPILGFVFGEKGIIGDLSLEGSKITKNERK